MFGWDFITAKVTLPILGAGFLCAYDLLVDVENRQLINAATFCSYRCTLGGTRSIRLSSMLSAMDNFLHLLAEFPDLTQPIFSSSATKHGVEHHITTTSQSVYTQARHLNPTKLTIARAEFENMVHLGIIHCSNSPWTPPLGIAPKPGGGWCPLGLNDATTPDRHPVPHIQDFSSGWQSHLLRGGPRLRLSPGSSPSAGCPQNSSYHTVWAF